MPESVCVPAARPDPVLPPRRALAAPVGAWLLAGAALVASAVPGIAAAERGMRRAVPAPATGRVTVPPSSTADSGALTVPGAGGSYVAPPAAAVPALPVASAALRRLDTFTSRTYARAEFTGVVLLVDNGRVAFARGYGDADRTRGTPVTASTLFPAGAITKLFTSVLVLQEVEKGHLSLDAPAGRYVHLDSPGVPDVTVRQLLLDVSGMRNFDAVYPEYQGVPGIYRVALDWSDPVAVVDRYTRGGLDYAHGERIRFNTLDYVLLAGILEKVTGLPFARLVQERIAGPLNLKNTRMAGPADPPELARGYLRGGRLLDEPEPYRLENYQAAGGLLTTAKDLARFAVALDRSELLSPAYTQAMFTPDPVLKSVALGSFVYSARVGPGSSMRTLAERQGAAGGFRTAFIREVGAERTLIVLANNANANLGTPFRRDGLPFEMLRLINGNPLR